MRIGISSGHGKYIRGASGILDEVDEARRIVAAVADKLTRAGHDVVEIHDDVSDNQSDNLNWLTKQHNQAFGDGGDVVVSVHLNANEQTSKCMGTEVLYLTQQALADKVSRAIAQAGEFTDRGPKYRDNLAILNNTIAPAILLEICFVDSSCDAQCYEDNWDAIVDAIAGCAPSMPDFPEEPRPEPGKVFFAGKTSTFGGPSDTGVSPSEDLAWWWDYEDQDLDEIEAPGVDNTRVPMFLDYQPSGTSGVARRLNAEEAFYIAAKWDYDNPVTTKAELARQDQWALVRANGREALVAPADWGPHGDTGRATDCSPALLSYLGIGTDDHLEMIYPVTKADRPDRPERPPPETEPDEEHWVDIQVRPNVKLQVESSPEVVVYVNGEPLKGR